VVTFDLPDTLVDEFAFQPGQYLTLRTQLNAEELRRSYSICTGVNDGELRIAVKRVAGGRFSAFANERLQPGHTLDVMPPA
ncbi:FAD-binding oxidoreductase, partial [Burkholderia sp. SIMBA_019]|uniref:FAD-binding oxidoreductase n=1 Tax=Burkholderia sp. SIMBA_019 TaxID=3085765 RepID=UPI00397AB467